MRSDLLFPCSLFVAVAWAQEFAGRAGGVLTAPVLSNPARTSTSTRPAASTKTSAPPALTAILTGAPTTIKTSTKPPTTIKTSTTTKKTSITTKTTSTTTAKPPTTTKTSAKPTTTKAVGPVVTDTAYINTVIRHHNVHRANHSANAITWSASLAQTAAKIASGCVFQHVMDTDGGGYGQNIGAGYSSTNMGQFITGGLYNGEVNSYTYYGGEPNINTLGDWGHFTQIVWKGTTAVGCYTYDCSKTGLGNAGGSIPPYFTVCNYSPPGNYIGSFSSNIGRSLRQPTVDASYGCGSPLNCVGSTSA